MYSSVFRTGTSIAAIAAAISVPAIVHAQTYSFDVPAQAASSGVRAFAEQAGIQIIVSGSAAQGRSTNAVRGNIDMRAALDQLISGTGLFIRSFDGKVVVLAAEEPSSTMELTQEFVVTGSRIARPELESAMPISVVNMEDMERLGRVTAYDALMREPAVAAGVGLSNSFGQQWDAGVASVSLRNLGTNRSLTLIDGMRRVSGSARSSAVDINMIPAAMIDRIEVVTGGAAAIYGADAVTGAVNIVTKRDIDSFNISATGGISQEGDAEEYAVSVSTGGLFADDRGSFAIGGTYSDTASLGFSDRHDTYVNYIANPENTGPDDGILDRVLVPDFRQIYYAYDPSFWFDGNSYLVENGVPRVAGYDTELLSGEFSYGDGGDGRNLRDEDQLRGGLEAFALIGRVDYDLTDSIRYSARFDYGRTKYDGAGKNPTYRDDTRAFWLNGAGGSVAYLDNPFVPSGVRQFMLDNGLSELPISRTYSGIMFPTIRTTHDRESFTLGQSLSGTLADSFAWDAFFQYGRTEDDVNTFNIPYASHWLAARDVIADPATGEPVCRDEAARAAGCIPLNIFGVEPASEELKSYVLGTRTEKRVNTQRIFGASLSGEVFTLPAGDVSIAVGAEHRKETLQTKDDPLADSPNELAHSGSGYSFHPTLDVESDVSEIYGEVVVPVLTDLPFARSLSIEGAYRYSDYSTVGGTNAWKVGATWTPIDWVTLRGVRSRSVRTPNFGELYEPQAVNTTGSYLDPCRGGDYYQNPTRTEHCKALGIDAPLGDVKVGPRVTTGGNPDLDPETSNSLTFGAVLEPEFLPGFDLTVDYWDIDIKGVITQFSYTTVLDLCVDMPTIDNAFCEAIDRDPVSGNATAVRSTQTNASRMLARGLDFGAHYHRPLGNGVLGLTFKGTYLLKQVVETTPGIAAGDVHYDGGWKNPRFRASLLTRYDIGDLSIAFDTRFISASTYDLTATDEGYIDNSVPPMLYNDISVQYSILDRYRIGVGVKNISDVRPPYGDDTYKDSVIYDAVGRYFFATLNMKL